MALLEIGAKAPDFTLSDDDGRSFRLSERRGRIVVLEFYPEDGTEGCTIENREFSALLAGFEAQGAEVVGISPQSVESHCGFRDRNKLKHRLLADPDLKAVEAYGLWAKKKMWGNEFMGLLRVTYIVGPDGRIAGVNRATRIKGHAQKVLDAVTSMTAKAPR